MYTDSIRYAVAGNVSFSYSNTDGAYLFQAMPSLTTQLKSKDLKKIYLFTGNYNLVRSENVDFQNSWFLHFRYNQELTEVLRLEAFVQSQNNELFTIKNRNLIGAGIRLKIPFSDVFKGYLGNSYMYEIETFNFSSDKAYNHRNSSYLSLSYLVKDDDDNVKLDITLYESLKNHRFLQQFMLSFPLSDAFSLTALFNYFYNNFSQIQDKEYSSYVSLGINVNKLWNPK
jgi:hypothetical protein